jgi:hypothetical protein
MKHKNPKPAEAGLQALTRQKSGRLLQARFLEAVGRAEEAAALYKEAAQDEEKIAAQLKKSGHEVEAAVNLVSAASCWRKANHQVRAIRLLDKVLATQGIPGALRREAETLRQEWSELSARDVRPTIQGIFRNGAVYPMEQVSITEGTVVTITLPTTHG